MRWTVPLPGSCGTIATAGNGDRARETRAPFHARVIALPGSGGIEVRSPDHLVSAHGEGGYTRIHLDDESPMLLSRVPWVRSNRLYGMRGCCVCIGRT